MSGEPSLTDGSASGTNGIVPLPLYGAVAAFIGVVILVNISSYAIEHSKMALWQPAVWELSSYVAILLLTPYIYFTYHRFHWRKPGLTRLVFTQAAAFLLFSLGHIAIMVVLRKIAYLIADEPYDFAQGQLALKLVYEGRKDAVTFLVVNGFCWVHERLSPATAPDLPERIEIRADGRTHYLLPAEILFAEAAGNYVELHMAGANPVLVRGTLNTYEGRLLPYGFVRIHRSRLLNRRHMHAFSGTASGDLRITLSDGRELGGSRRFRDRLG